MSKMSKATKIVDKSRNKRNDHRSVQDTESSHINLSMINSEKYLPDKEKYGRTAYKTELKNMKNVKNREKVESYKSLRKTNIVDKSRNKQNGHRSVQDTESRHRNLSIINSEKYLQDKNKGRTADKIKLKNMKNDKNREKVESYKNLRKINPSVKSKSNDNNSNYKHNKYNENYLVPKKDQLNRDTKTKLTTNEISVKDKFKTRSPEELKSNLSNYIEKSKQSTVVKSVVQVAGNLKRTPCQYKNSFDLRSKIPQRKFKDCIMKLRRGVLKNSKVKRDNLLITIPNDTENNEDDKIADNEKIQEEHTLGSQNLSSNVQQIKIVINIIAHKRAKNDIVDDEDNVDLSFLDDIDVDEIVETINCSNEDEVFCNTIPLNNETESTDESMLDVYKNIETLKSTQNTNTESTNINVENRLFQQTKYQEVNETNNTIPISDIAGGENIITGIRRQSVTSKMETVDFNTIDILHRISDSKMCNESVEVETAISTENQKVSKDKSKSDFIIDELNEIKLYMEQTSKQSNGINLINVESQPVKELKTVVDKCLHSSVAQSNYHNVIEMETLKDVQNTNVIDDKCDFGDIIIISDDDSENTLNLHHNLEDINDDLQDTQYAAINLDLLNPIKPESSQKPSSKLFNSQVSCLEHNNEVSELNPTISNPELTDKVARKRKFEQTNISKTISQVKITEPSENKIQTIKTIISDKTNKTELSTTIIKHIRNEKHKIIVKLLEKIMMKYLGFPHFRTDFICKGKFSNIYKCETLNGEKYAVKMIREKQHQSPRSIEQDKMLKLLQKDIPRENLNFPYLYNGFGLLKGWCFLMEYFPTNLREALASNGQPFHIDVVQALSRQLVAAVIILRHNNVVHSEIRPSHILVNITKTKLALTGFDKSYYIDKVNLKPNMSWPSYRAPEVILGHSAGFGIDVWSTALIMYEMATNQKLFVGNFNNEILHNQQAILGKVPDDMLQSSKLKDDHFRGNVFKLRYGYKGLKVKFVEDYIKNDKLDNDIMKMHLSYCPDNEEPCVSERTKVESWARVKVFISLLKKMLVIHPNHRLPIEFAYTNPFIYS